MTGRAAGVESPTWRIINPLPAGLAHYQAELLAVLEAAGHPCVVEDSIPVEIAEPWRWKRATRATRLVTSRLRGSSAKGPTLVTWPALGMYDDLTWVRRRRPVLVVCHDPDPLRPQLGMGAEAGRVGRRLPGSSVQIVAHTDLARDALLRRGIEAVVVPHPILTPIDVPNVLRTDIAVLGQWKEARSLDPLHAIAASQRWRGSLVLGGRDWPAVPGWQVTSEFLPESELAARIRRARCLLLPYERYFQSGVAVRCLESLTPVVGLRHEFLESLFGTDWPGLVNHADDWVAATERAMRVPVDDVRALRDDYWQRCSERWLAFADDVVASRD